MRLLSIFPIFTREKSIVEFFSQFFFTFFLSHSLSLTHFFSLSSILQCQQQIPNGWNKHWNNKCSNFFSRWVNLLPFLFLSFFSFSFFLPLSHFSPLKEGDGERKRERHSFTFSFRSNKLVFTLPSLWFLLSSFFSSFSFSLFLSSFFFYLLDDDLISFTFFFLFRPIQESASTGNWYTFPSQETSFPLFLEDAKLEDAEEMKKKIRQERKQEKSERERKRTTCN